MAGVGAGGGDPAGGGRRAARQAELPAPLAEPRLDFRVDKASALSYEVREGEYIQIIDVAGRQCSDFLAFHAHKLDKGIERGLDPQVTRTLMGSAYPTVGLHSKYFDADMDPLCQVVQDTVGRHDSFALACTARYYEDLGYPGHVNCTENFNGQLGQYGIAPKKGWPALNFFYNTLFDPDLVLMSDEPWSRPGDYVLLRAMSDLVCASSACPDDIDPANGWEVTDVHVRVYSPENRFSMAIAHRVTPEAEPVLTKETGFHERWSKLTRNVTEYRGYWLPTCFTNEGAVAEYWACREKAAVMDLSPLRKWEILGPDAEALVQHAVTRDIRRLADGQVVYTAVCNETGGMIDDATVFRLDAGQLPLRRRRRVRRRAPQAARRAARARARVGQAHDRRAAQRRRPGAGEPRDPQAVRVGAGHAAQARGAALVPLPDRARSAPTTASR